MATDLLLRPFRTPLTISGSDVACQLRTGAERVLPATHTALDSGGMAGP